jgi:hypothetical protein
MRSPTGRETRPTANVPGCCFRRALFECPAYRERVLWLAARCLELGPTSLAKATANFFKVDAIAERGSDRVSVLF